MKKEDWERAKGDPCPRCGQDTVRLIDGACPACAKKAKERSEQEAEMAALSRSLREQRARNRR